MLRLRKRFGGATQLRQRQIKLDPILTAVFLVSEHPSLLYTLPPLISHSPASRLRLTDTFKGVCWNGKRVPQVGYSSTRSKKQKTKKPDFPFTLSLLSHFGSEPKLRSWLCISIAILLHIWWCEELNLALTVRISCKHLLNIQSNEGKFDCGLYLCVVSCSIGCSIGPESSVLSVESKALVSSLHELLTPVSRKTGWPIKSKLWPIRWMFNPAVLLKALIL